MFKRFMLIVLANIMILSTPEILSTQTYEATETTTTEIEILEIPVISSKYKSLGTFLITAYCHCISCCDKEDGITATGTKATEGRTISVDPRVIPYGTEVKFNGNTYVSEDCGGKIKKKKIDLYFASHQAALNWGKQYHEVFVRNTNPTTQVQILLK